MRQVYYSTKQVFILHNRTLFLFDWYLGTPVQRVQHSSKPRPVPTTPDSKTTTNLQRHLPALEEGDGLNVPVGDPVDEVEGQEDWRGQPHRPRVDIVAQCLLVGAHTAVPLNIDYILHTT